MFSLRALTAGLSILTASAVQFTLFQDSTSCDLSSPGVNATVVKDVNGMWCETTYNTNTYSARLDSVEPYYYFCTLVLFPQGSSCEWQDRIGLTSASGTCLTTSVPIGAYSLACALT